MGAYLLIGLIAGSVLFGFLIGALLANERQVHARSLEARRPRELDFSVAAVRGELDLPGELDWSFPMSPGIHISTVQPRSLGA